MSAALPATSGFLRLLHQIGRLPALPRLLLSIVPGVLAWWQTPPAANWLLHAVAAWDAYAWSLLLLLWAAILTAAPARIRDVATAEDSGRILLFVVALVGVVASLLAVVVLLRTLHTLPPSLFVGQVVLAAAAVSGAWLLLHTLFTLRYAHFYYDPDVDGKEGGLEFPGEDFQPDYLDFAYFAFTIGMAAQTADVAISGRQARRLALLHSLISFGFNTALVAMSISALAGVL